MKSKRSSVGLGILSPPINIGTETGLFIKGLRKESAKLHKRIAKLEVENLSLKNRIKAAESEFTKQRPIIQYDVDFGGISVEYLEKLIDELGKQNGYVKISPQR